MVAQRLVDAILRSLPGALICAVPHTFEYFDGSSQQSHTPVSSASSQNPANYSNFCDAAYLPAIEQARRLVQCYGLEAGLVGLSIGVSVNGKLVWKDGFGVADFETNSPCHGDTIMRIASISKPITMAVVAKLWQEGKLDLDAPIQKYLPDFPTKTWKDQPVLITSRMLASHTSGIRHYEKAVESVSGQSKPAESQQVCPACKKEIAQKKKEEFANAEYFLRRQFDTVGEALKLFKDDALVAQPGTKFVYSTHGWTLLSAVAEAAAGQKFTDLLQSLFRELGMTHTFVDQNAPVILNRAKYYTRTAKHKLVNVPEVNNSYKLAGGGLLSNVTDLLTFANAMLFSYQYSDHSMPKHSTVQPSQLSLSESKDGNIVANFPCRSSSASPFLKSTTVRKLWTPVQIAKANWAGPGHYGLGWALVSHPQDSENEKTADSRGPFAVLHTGGAVGASSVLYIQPISKEPADHVTLIPANQREAKCGCGCCAESMTAPDGVCVAILTNMQEAGVGNLARQVAAQFVYINY